jgi:tetratricopeptide (TPR) repeat protein
MAKSNRRRKLDRAKRQARDSQKQAASRRQQEWQLELEAAAERIKRLANPDSPLAETAGLLHTTYGGGPISTFAVNRMLDFGWSTERLTELADAMFASGEVGEASDAGEHEPSLTTLTFAAQVARAAGDRSRASELLDQALAATEASGDSYARLRLTDHLRWIGRLPEAIELLEASLRDDPDDEYAAEHYGIAISDAYEQASGPQPVNGCTCGNGVAWEECCGPRERAVLGRFTDRSGLTELGDAVSGFLAGSEYGQAVDDEISRHLVAFEDVKLRPDDVDSFRALVAENALLTAKAEIEIGHQDTEARTAIGAFAEDPSVSAELAARAQAWREHFHYGLWKVESEPAAPGLWCTDICTGELRYAGFPAQFTDGTDDPMRIGAAEPHSILAEQQDPMPPHVASVTRLAIAQLLWRIFLEVHLDRRAKPLRGRAFTGDYREKSWLDEPLTVLHGRTPRQSAVGEDRRRLESMLRQFEYEADELAAQGQSGVDTGWLREELEMPLMSLDD